MFARTLLISALIVPVAVPAGAQAPGDVMAPAGQTTQNATVPAETATHVVHLARSVANGGAAAALAGGTGWLAVDASSRSIAWTIEFAGTRDVTMAAIMCSPEGSPPAGGPPPPAATPAPSGNVSDAPRMGAGVAVEGRVAVVDLILRPQPAAVAIQGQATDLAQSVFIGIANGLCIVAITDEVDPVFQVTGLIIAAN